MARAIALDLGGTRIKIGIVEAGRLLAHSVIGAESAEGFRKRLPSIENEMASLLRQTGMSRTEVSGIGLSMPGIVDVNEKRLLSVNGKFSDAVGFDFAGWARDRWSLPVVLENDARSALIGEWRHGAGRGCDNLVMVTLGTGIGGAAVIEGKVLRGIHYQAGILPGHFTVNVHGAACNCGNVGCVEAEASSWRLPDIVANNPLFSTSSLSKLDVIDYKAVFGQARLGDSLSAEIVSLSIETWAACVINLIHAYDPEIVIVGGGIARSAPDILPGISEKVSKHAWTPWGKVRIVPAEQPDFAALLGAAHLVELSKTN